MKFAPGARRAPSFGSVLAQIEQERDEDERIVRPLAYPFAAVDPPAEPSGSTAQPAAAWSHAFAWVEGTRDPPPTDSPPDAPPAAPLSDDPQAIAQELGLDKAKTLGELGQARRRFMWANHPDRRPDAPRELANRRVAIANMLIDRAEAALTGARRRR